MNQKSLWVAASIIAAVVIVGFVLSVPHTHDVAGAPETQSAVPQVSAVTLHDVFKKGVHTITGSLTAPDACTVVTANATVTGESTSTERIIVAISMPQDEGVCLQVPTNVSFSTTVSALASLPISATVNGTAATTTSS
jgi:hypothetical protein